MSRRFLIAFAFLVMVGFAASGQVISPHSTEHLEKWSAFKVCIYAFLDKFAKYYDTDLEESIRFESFVQSLNTIEQNNQMYMEGKSSFTMGQNRFSDWTDEEYLQYVGFTETRTIVIRSIASNSMLNQLDRQIPDRIDWVKLGAVTPVKDQGDCGSCWAFSTSGAVEGQHFRKTKKLVSLSEQNLIDCTSSGGNSGCNGGFMEIAFNYVKENNGIDTEQSYPYEGRDGECRFNASNVGAMVTGMVSVPVSEDKLKEAVALVGPVSVSMDSSQIRHYNGGVHYQANCSRTHGGHAMLVVGYGSENGLDYWLLKNSFGQSWGDNGYLKIVRNKDNNCGIASSATYPLV